MSDFTLLCVVEHTVAVGKYVRLLQIEISKQKVKSLYSGILGFHLLWYSQVRKYFSVF
jgi:hypothetical protein